jgi:hypothetical protein
MSEKLGAMVRVDRLPRREGYEECFKATLDCDSATSDGLILCRHEATALLAQLAAALKMEPAPKDPP